MKGTNLGEFQELVMLVVGMLYDDAYGISIKDAIEQQSGRKVTLSTVHSALNRLEDKGLLISYMSEPIKARGGRPKRLFKITTVGREALIENRELRNRIWEHIPKVAWENM